MYRKTNKMYKIGKFTKYLAFAIVITIFLSVVIYGIAGQSIYHFDDYPYFAGNSLWNYAGLLISIGSVILFVFLKSKLKISLYVCIAFYLAVLILFVMLVNLYPFSDMLNIFNIATNNLKDESGYLSMYNNQIPITLYLYVLSYLGKGIIIPKIFNIICNIIVVIMIYKIYSHIFEKDKLNILLTITFIPAVIYTNHIYNDTISTALTVSAAYFAIDKNRSNAKFVMLIILSAFAVWLRASNILFVIAICMYYILSCRMWKQAFIYIGCFAVIFGGLNIISNKAVNVEAGKSFPIWSFIQMGLNEEEFGFQNSSHSVEWTAKDCVDRINELGAERTIKLLAKKELWMWSEGTFQAERYGFGDENAIYARENIITRNLRKMDDSSIRKSVNYLMKGQYYLYIIFALAGVIFARKENIIEIFLYFICGFFFFYMIWEMKSRYIYSLYPYIIIFASYGINVIMNKYSLYKSQEKN